MADLPWRYMDESAQDRLISGYPATFHIESGQEDYYFGSWWQARRPSLLKFTGKMTVFSRIISLLLFLPLVLHAEGSEGRWVVIDTTRVREVQPIEKSTGQKIADVPGEILKLPVKAVRLMTKGVYYGVTRTPLQRLLNIGNPISPFFFVGGFSSTAGYKAGLGYRPRDIFHDGDFLKMAFYYSTNEYQSYQIKYNGPMLLGERTGVVLDFRYKNRPRERFYGLGNDSKEGNEANYGLEYADFLFDIRKRITPEFSIALRGGFNVSNTFDGEDPDLIGDLDSLVAGSVWGLRKGQFRSVRYMRAGIELEYDGRDHPGQPSKGNLIDFSFIRNIGVARSKDLKFNYIRLGYSQYLNLWRKRILAARLFIQRFNVDHDDDVVTPVYLTSGLGGLETLRGYRKNRFLDKDLALVSLEYRWPIWRIFDAFLFLDEGRVYDEITDSPLFEDWKYSVGAGVRIWSEDGVQLMLLGARSREGTRFYAEVGASW
jgi:hypothetical protein